MRAVTFALGALLSAGYAPTVERTTRHGTAGIRDDLFAITTGLDPDRVLTVGPHPGWEPRPDLELDAQLPAPWPESFLTTYHQHFAPWPFQVNASLLASHVRRHPESRDLVRPIADALYDRLLEHTEPVGEARFVVYRFGRRYEGVRVRAPWTSGLGNGAAISGLVALDHAFGDPRYLATARELAAAYRIPGPSTEHLWFSLVADQGYLWFEEQPLDDPVQPMILNGHVTALTGLYYLWDRGGRDPEVLELLSAGLTAAAHYGPRFRVPGAANRYQLREPGHPDYGPARTVRQQQVMYAMTGDPRFLELRDQFATDMGIDPEGFATPLA
ncbi:D-glucuronyl C5-epimerase family protein [Aeromicrobium sp. JJY06]|uniref:D-glucuronyl C5-epimerase family protein n=1 Tax=Aeromicrobium sp. JJY06 TaxID=3373478 RepID=UPI00376EEB24